MSSNSGSSSSSSSGGGDKKYAPMPVGVGYAPAGAYLGTTASGNSLVSMGTGDSSGRGNTAVEYYPETGYYRTQDGQLYTSDDKPVGGSERTLPEPADWESTPTKTNYIPVTGGSTGGGGPRPEPLTGTKGDEGGGGGTSTGGGSGGGGTGGGGTGGGGSGGGGGGGGGGGAITTDVNTNPRGDFSVVLAGMQGEKANRGPARSNSFISLIGGAGGLGRRTSEAKRTLIGGA